jgi:hypothetical protein
MFDREKAISKMEVYAKNHFKYIDNLDIKLEDKFIAFRSYLDALHTGYYVGIISTGLIMGSDTDVAFILDMMSAYNRYDDKEISMEDAWVYISKLAKGEVRTEYII